MMRAWFVVMMSLIWGRATAAVDASCGPDAAASDGAEYRLGVGDVVEIAVAGAPETPKDVTIQTDGTVMVPLLGRVHAATLTVRELKATLTQRLARTHMRDPKVEVKRHRSDHAALHAASPLRAFLPVGVELSFGAESGGRATERERLPGSVRVGGDSRIVDRIVVDNKRRLFTGYRLEVDPTLSGDAWRISIKPLPDHLKSPSECRDCEPWAIMKPARYPDPFEVRSGAEFLVELLDNAATGDTIADRVKLVGAPRPSWDAPSEPDDRLRLNVKATLSWKERRQFRFLAARFCIRPLAADGSVGPLLSSPEVEVSVHADSHGRSEVSQRVEMRTSDGRRTTLHLSIVVSVSPGGKAGSYTVEIREGRGSTDRGPILYSEDVSFPLG